MTNDNHTDSREEQLFERVQGRTVIDPPVPGYKEDGLAVDVDMTAPKSEQVKIHAISPDGDLSTVAIDPGSLSELSAFLDAVAEAIKR